MKNFSGWLTLGLGFYFLAIGAAAGFYLPQMESNRDMKVRLFEQVSPRVEKLEARRQEYVFRDTSDRVRSDELLAEMRESRDLYFKAEVARTSWLVLAISVLGYALAGLWLVLGIGVLGPFPWVRPGISVGLWLWVAYLGLVSLNIYQEISFLDNIFVRAWELTVYLQPTTAAAESRTLARALTNFALSRSVLLTAVGSMIYFVAPLFLLSRRAVREFLGAA